MTHCPNYFKKIIKQAKHLEDTPEGEVLRYSEKYRAYTLGSPYDVASGFLGDKDDFINVKLGNFQFIKDKYSLTEDSYSLRNDYSTDPEGNVITGYVLNEAAKNRMPKGIYSLVSLDYGTTGFKPITINTDDFIDFNNPSISKFENRLKEFFTQKEKYKQEGARHKGAALLYGPPGGGKTTVILNTVNSLASDVYCIFVSKSMSLGALNEYKDLFKGENVIVILEELTERISSGTEDLLNFLDGYASWENCYVVATTNYPEELAANLVSRPGRFNQLIEFKHPTDDHKTEFLKKKGFSEEEINIVLPRSKDFSLDDIAQIAIQSRIENLNLNDYLNEIEAVKKKVKTAFTGKDGKMGIR